MELSKKYIIHFTIDWFEQLRKNYQIMKNESFFFFYSIKLRHTSTVNFKRFYVQYIHKQKYSV